MSDATSQELPVRPYELDEASLELPQILKDKTVHVFALNDDGPNEFNLVVSRAEAQTDDTLDEFAERLSAELKKALPKFQLKRRQEATVDGSPAVELFYQWSNNGIAMQQRQTITLVQAAHAPVPQALMVAGTCMHAFTEHWHGVYDRALASMKVRRPWPPVAIGEAANDEGPSAEAEPPLVLMPCAFALSRNHTLHVFASLEEIPAHVGALEVEEGLWKFYDQDGHPAEVLWQQPNRRGLLRAEPGRFLLRRAGADHALAPLGSRLATIERVQGLMNSLAELQNHLEAAASERVNA